MKSYNPKSVAVIVDGFQLTNFAEDTKVEVAFRNPAYDLMIGADGDGTRVQSNDNSATIKISLAQSSDSNDKLSAIALADRTNGGGIVTVMVKDISGRSLFVAAQAYIEKLPDSSFGKKVNSREWTFVTDNLIATVGGN